MLNIKSTKRKHFIFVVCFKIYVYLCKCVEKMVFFTMFMHNQVFLQENFKKK